jgi:hypothetical protein
VFRRLLRIRILGRRRASRSRIGYWTLRPRVHGKTLGRIAYPSRRDVLPGCYSDYYKSHRRRCRQDGMHPYPDRYGRKHSYDIIGVTAFDRPATISPVNILPGRIRC